MSNDRVDTNRPEYSWIPFFEELAQRLHEDGWRHRQPEIVAELQRMRSEGMVIAPWVDNLTEWIDPFSLIGTIRRVRFDNAVPIMRSFKAFFGVDAQVPVEDPITPTLQAQKSFLFTGIGQDGQTEIHWDLFDRLMSIDDLGDNSDLADLLNKSVAIYNVGAANLSGALFWIKPHVCLKTDTIAHFLNTWDYSDFGRKYLENLIRVREIDSRPFPVLNADAWLTSQIDGSKNVWAMNAGEGGFAREWWLEGGYVALDWGVTGTDLAPLNTEDEVRAALEPFDLPGVAIGQFVNLRLNLRRGDIVVMSSDEPGWHHFGIVCSDITYLAVSDSDPDIHRNRKGVIWHSQLVRTGNLNLPGPAALMRVVAKNEVVRRRVTDVVRGRPDAPRVWVVRADGGKNTASFVEHGYVGTSWDELDLAACSNLDDIKAEIRGKQDNDDEQSVGRQAGTLKKFLLDMKPGDWVLTPDPPDDGTFYYGMVLGAPTFVHVDDQDNPTDGLPCRQRRPVEWFKDDVRRNDELPNNAWLQPTVYELKDEVRDAFPALVGAPSKKTARRDPYTVDTMIDEGAFLERDELDRIMAQLERKKNLILQGPPGTGKTFLAKRFAYARMGERADERIASVQFHQSYSYEDFVGGYRPAVTDDQQLVFESRDGAFLRLCQRAREAPYERFVMLIDEINRGNLSRVFGELLMLIEADKRSPEHAVELQHRMADVDSTDGKFFVPPNVYIIGTMNLADRSLTGMNVAMRRRFAFAELRPQFDNRRFAAEVKKTGMLDDMLDRIRTRMVALNATIEDDASLGRQYAVGHSFFCPDSDGPPGGDWDAWYEAVVEFEIRPLLEEYWFDDATKAADEVGKLKLEGGR